MTLTRFGAWRWGVASVAVALAGVAGTWLAAAGSPAAGWPWPLTAFGVVLLALWLVAVQPRPRPITLHWDGARWQVGEPPRSGDLRVAIDLGGWMLLRFTADAPSPARRVSWIAAQRAGHAAQWHALRCAVYSPRPDAGADAAPDV